MQKHFMGRFNSFESWLTCLSLLVICLFLLAILLGIFVPVYTDEVATKMMLARFFAENGKIVTVFPQCGPSHIINTPVLFYPAAWVYALLYAKLLPLGIRISGVLMALVYVGLIGLWLFKTNTVRRNLIYLFAAIATILGLGVLPFLSVISRAEQLLFLLIVLFSILPTLSNRMQLNVSGFRVLFLLLFFILITSIFFYSHPKAIFFFPLCLASAYYTFGLKRKYILALAVCLVLLCTIQNYLLSKATVQCTPAPQLTAMLASQTIDLSLLKSEPRQFLVEMADNIINAPAKISEQVAFKYHYQSGWLPAPVQMSSDWLFNCINSLINNILPIVILASLVLPSIWMVSKKTEQKFYARYFMVLSLMLGLLGHLALYKVWNFYAVSLVLPLSVWILILVFSDTFLIKINLKQAKLALAMFLLLSLSSFYVLFSTVLPKLVQTNYGDSATLVGQPLSVVTFNFDAEKQKLKKLAKACGLNGDNQSSLVVDDLSYFAFNDLHTPLHVVYLNDAGFGVDIAGDKLTHFLSSLQSPGIIAQCTYFPKVYQRKTIQQNNLCCVNLKP
jgi:hypothetical protein